MKTLQVALGARSYPIYIGPGAMGLPELAEHIAGTEVLLVTNTTVGLLYADQLCAALSGYRLERVTLPDGEAYKTLDALMPIFDAALTARFGRRLTVVALGGGVIGDMAGFAAASYQRGVPFIQIPTTLLSQVDSSVGGKTGVNHPLGKNMIGAFYQPKAVFADTAVLATLPPRELSAGLAEVIKYGLLGDRLFLAWIETHLAALMALDADLMADAIAQCCAMKAAIVSDDEREAGGRALLNLGHTFGHAIEAHQGYGSWLHGEAVAVGLIMAAHCSAELGLLSLDDVSRVTRLCALAGLPTQPPKGMRPGDFLTHMAVDKKNQDGRLRLILMRQLGDAYIEDAVNERALMATLERSCCV